MYRELFFLALGSAALAELTVPFEHSLPCMTQPISTVYARDSVRFECVL